ncbi:hypothetical protein EVAR_55875_1 [Eumeta japonica]|uniref:Uncharacterized protein n=1 Tax=Eumeta variegata TaxID=151549 RepID=A0A4C1YH11_EUMVA|nr:hypothetical protein EVAR_55875_1 [Eumeta japonica]
MDLSLDSAINSSQIENKDKNSLFATHVEKKSYVRLTEAECTRDHRDKSNQQILARSLQNASRIKGHRARGNPGVKNIYKERKERDNISNPRQRIGRRNWGRRDKKHFFIILYSESACAVTD